MLVFSRHINEKVIISTPEGRVIEVILVDVLPPYKARIGFTADREVTIHREEVQLRIEEHKHAVHGVGGGRQDTVGDERPG